MSLKNLMISWWKRFHCYSFWDDIASEDGGKRPLISFSLDGWFTETRPAFYYTYNDTDRWRGVHIRLHISRRLFAISIPFKKLPDYLPTNRSMLRTRELGKKQQERNDAAKKIQM